MIGVVALDLEDFFDRRLERILNGLASLPVVDAVAQIDVSGETPGIWQVVLSKGQARVLRGDEARPSFRLMAHEEDWRDLLEGAARLQACLIDGRLEVEGDLGLAMQIAPMLLSVELL